VIDFNDNENDRTGPRRSKFWRLRDSARRQPQPWRWPLQRLGDRDALIMQARLDDARHGVLIGYEVRPGDLELDVPVYAAQDGEVMLAGETASGFAIGIDHRAHGLATYYAQLSKMCVAPNHLYRNRKRQRVYGGDVIGYAARSSIEIRFALWKWTDVRGFVPVDPIPQLEKWATERAHETTTQPAQAA
jgi:hypothetical protein